MAPAQYATLSGMPLADGFNGVYELDEAAPEVNGKPHYVNVERVDADGQVVALKSELRPHLYVLPGGQWGLSSSFEPEATSANAFCGTPDLEFPAGLREWQYCDEDSVWKKCSITIEHPATPPPAVSIEGLPGGILDGTYELETVAPLRYCMQHITGKVYSLYRQKKNATWIISPQFPEALSANAFCAKRVPLPGLPFGSGEGGAGALEWKYWDGKGWLEAAVQTRALSDHKPVARKAASAIQASIRGRITRRLLRDKMGAEDYDKLQDTAGSVASPSQALEAFTSGCR